MNYRFVLSDLKIINLQFLLTVDNDISCHVTSGDFQKRPQGKKCYLTCQCSISSKKTKVTQFARLCRTNDLPIRNHPFSTYVKSSEKLTFLTPWYAHVCVRIRGSEILFFRKFCVCTKWINPYIISLTWKFIIFLQSFLKYYLLSSSFPSLYFWLFNSKYSFT